MYILLKSRVHIVTGRSGMRQPSGLHRGLGGSDPRLLEHTTPNSSRGASPARSHNSPSASQTDIRQGPRTSRLQTPQVNFQTKPREFLGECHCH